MIQPDLISTLIGLLVIVAGGYYAVKGVQSKSLKENQKDLIDVLMLGKEEQKSEMKELQKKHQKSQQDIANLQGQVDTLKTVPLEKIGLELVEIKTTQSKLIEATNVILEHITGSGTPRTEP